MWTPVSRPFSVTPTCGTLDVGESMQVIVSFNPETMGDHIENLILHYHSGKGTWGYWRDQHNTILMVLQDTLGLN